MGSNDSIHMSCPFCPPGVYRKSLGADNDLCLFIEEDDPVLKGSGIIVPKAHRETAFDLTPEEFSATFSLLSKVKRIMDRSLRPDGYNLGWNCGAIGGQEVFHAHMHVIPRFRDEPYAGRGIRYWLRQESNRRGSGG